MICRWKNLCSFRRIETLKKTSLMLALVTFVYLVVFSFQRPPTVTLHGVEADFDYKPIPYTSFAQCDRTSKGEVNCPDIRRKGTTLLRQAQLVLTRMLRIFDLIAKKHGIRYWLYRGTLLGAVRHNGHIPFDDDVDICIPKADYEKFVEYGSKELPDDIFFQTEETDAHWAVPAWSGMLGKLRDTRSCYKSCSGHCKYNDGLQLDIFVVENDSSGNFIEIYSHPKWFFRRYIYGPFIRKHSDIFPLTEVNFDGFYLPAPREWKKILHSLYDDFMIIPTNEKLGHVITDILHSCGEIKLNR